MKLKGKLILSCAALAAVATTAFSTTYAWYTSNATVNASGLAVGTTAGGSDSLQISKDAVEWGTTVNININTQTLVPVQYGADGSTADGTYLLWNQATNAASGAAGAGSAYVEFNLFFRNIAQTASTSKVYMKQLSVTNNTSSLVATKALTATGLYPSTKNVKDNPTYKIDLLRALDLEIVSKSVVAEGDFVGASSADTVKLANNGDGVANKVFLLDNYHTIADDFTAGTSNAHTYYNAVKGLVSNETAATTDDPIATTDPLADATGKPAFLSTLTNMSTAVAQGSAVDLGSAYGQTYLKTTWRLFINGWDLACFDAIKGQNISLSMAFDTFNAPATNN